MTNCGTGAPSPQPLSRKRARGFAAQLPLLPFGGPKGRMGAAPVAPIKTIRT